MHYEREEQQEPPEEEMLPRDSLQSPTATIDPMPNGSSTLQTAQEGQPSQPQTSYRKERSLGTQALHKSVNDDEITRNVLQFPNRDSEAIKVANTEQEENPLNLIISQKTLKNTINSPMGL